MSAASTAPLRVLVAEDEPAMLSLVTRHLKNLGFSVVEASEGDVAWRMAQEHVPDLILLDVMMPGMSGWEVCRRIKGEAGEGRPFAQTGVIMLTGIGENLNEMTSPLFSADAWLNKPFEFADLDDRLREVLGRYNKEPGPAYEAGSAESGNVRSRRGARASASSKRTSIPPKSAAPAKRAASATTSSRKASAAKGAAAKKTATRAGAAKGAAAKKTATRAGAAKGAAAKKTATRAGAAKGAAAKGAAAKGAAAKKTTRAGAAKKAAPARKTAGRAGARKAGAATAKRSAGKSSARSAKKSSGR